MPAGSGQPAAVGGSIQTIASAAIWRSLRQVKSSQQAMKVRVFREEPAKAEKQAGYGGPQETQRAMAGHTGQAKRDMAVRAC